MKAYRAGIYERVEKGWITAEEASSLISAAMRNETQGADPTRVRCGKCGTVHTFIGVGQQFTCDCAPGQIQSVWDNRIK